MQAAADPTADMELADLMLQLQFLSHRAESAQIVGDDDANPQALDQRGQPAAHRLWVPFVHLTQGDRLTGAQIDSH